MPLTGRCRFAAKQGAKNGGCYNNENELEVLYERDSTFITINKVYADGQWHILLKEV